VDFPSNAAEPVHQVIRFLGLDPNLFFQAGNDEFSRLAQEARQVAVVRVGRQKTAHLQVSLHHGNAHLVHLVYYCFIIKFHTQLFCHFTQHPIQCFTAIGKVRNLD
jgi:hypothetical protein